MNHVIISPTESEAARRKEVMERILECVKQNVTIKLPIFDPSLDRPSDDYALLSIGLEPNQFSGTVGEFRYQFEGEEDLLHLIVTRDDMGELDAKAGQEVAEFVLNGMPQALVWMRQGERSQHFYFGHDELLNHLIL